MTAHPSTPRRYLALWLPFLPTDRLERTRPHGSAPAEPLVLFETVRSALRLSALNRPARELGLTAGLTLADARARIPDLKAFERDPVAEDALLARMAEACDRWTPLVALDEPHGLMLDVTGCAHLFSGEATLRLAILRRFKVQGFAARATIAGTPDCARALARFGRTAIVAPQEASRLSHPPRKGRAIPYGGAGSDPSPCKGEGGPWRKPRVGWGSVRVELDPDRSPPCPPLCKGRDRARLGTSRSSRNTPDFTRCDSPPRKEEGDRRSPPEEAAVRPLPIAALRLDEATRAALSLAGLKRISDLLDRPSQPLAARFGEALTTKLRRVSGYEDVRITPLRPPPAVRVEANFAEPIASTDAIEAALENLLGQAARRLEASGKGGRAFEARFFRTDGAVRRIGVGTGRPSRGPRALMRLFREKLDALDDPLDPGFGFDLIRLEVPAVEPLDPVQPDFDRAAHEDDGVAELVDRLVARFGPARVLRFTGADSHDPLRASTLGPAIAAPARNVAAPEVEPGDPPLRPVQLFDPPQPIETLAETPDGPPVRFRWRRALHRVARAEGPERIAAEWWRTPGAPTRDYYRVEDEDGRRFWIFRSGLYGREAGKPRWFLHGLFA